MKNIPFNLSMKDLQKIKALCEYFQKIVEVIQRPSCFGDYEITYDRYFEIVDLINNYQENWG